MLLDLLRDRWAETTGGPNNLRATGHVQPSFVNAVRLNNRGKSVEEIHDLFGFFQMHRDREEPSFILGHLRKAQCTVMAVERPKHALHSWRPE